MGKSHVIIDSCYSGSALPHLGQSGREVYTSVGADELSTGEYDRRFAEALGGVEADVDGDGVVEMWEADLWGKGVSRIVHNVMNFRTDTDGDGFDNTLENNTGFWNSIGVTGDDLPEWNIPDIYVEVDWMESGFGAKEILWNWLLGFAGLLFVIGICLLVPPATPAGLICFILGLLAIAALTIWRIVDDSFCFEEIRFNVGAKENVIEAFDNAPKSLYPNGIRIHIDDGGMGGGESIPFTGYLYTDPDPDHVDFEELQELHFFENYTDISTHPRYNIFYYCILCHNGYDNDDGDTEFDGITQPWGFQINNNNMGNFPHTPWEDQAQTFIHELGHKLGLAKTSSRHCPNKATNGDWCAMRSCEHQSTSSFNNDYCYKCWSNISF